LYLYIYIYIYIIPLCVSQFPMLRKTQYFLCLCSIFLRNNVICDPDYANLRFSESSGNLAIPQVGSDKAFMEVLESITGLRANSSTVPGDALSNIESVVAAQKYVERLAALPGNFPMVTAFRNGFLHPEGSENPLVDGRVIEMISSGTGRQTPLKWDAKNKALVKTAFRAASNETSRGVIHGENLSGIDTRGVLTGFEVPHNTTP